MKVGAIAACIALSCICNEARATGLYFDGAIGAGYSWTVVGGTGHTAPALLLGASPAYALSSVYALALGLDLLVVLDQFDSAIVGSTSAVGLVRPHGGPVEVALACGYAFASIQESPSPDYTGPGPAWGPRASLRIGYIPQEEVIGFGIVALAAYLKSEYATQVPITVAAQFLVSTW